VSSIGRSKSPSRKINDIEINEKGVFREKSPASLKLSLFF